MHPAAPPPPVFRFATLFRLRLTARRWRFALRASLCMGVPVLVGWLAGDIAAGLMATIGAFTALCGSDRPYLNRAAHLALIAVSFALAVMLGVWAAETPLIVVPTIVLIAMVSAFLCNTLQTGPPGAYMFALACAAGTAIPISHLTVLQVGLLVFSGGAFAWLAHMAGAIVQPRGPEKAAVTAAAQAIANYASAVGTPGEDGARHAAAMVLHRAWTVLVAFQPARPRPSGSLSRLRALNRALHLLFAGIMNTPNPDSTAMAQVAGQARAIAEQARQTRGRGEPTDPNHVPLGHHGALKSLRESLRPWSPVLVSTVRVGVATAIAGTIGIMLGLERAYWTMAAAVLILHQGLNWMRSLQRGIERMAGTLVGLILAWGVLSIHPEGLWLVATLMIIQFTIEMTVVGNYALAVVFITAAALTIATGGQPVPDIEHLLWVRGEDTVIGCLVGLAVLALTSHRAIDMRIPRELVRLLVASKKALAHAAKGNVTSPAARRARRDLQDSTFGLLQAYETSVGATPWHRSAAERAWPTVSTAQRLAYRILALCWSLENSGTGQARMVHTLFGADGARHIGHALLDLAQAIRADAKPKPLGPLPACLGAEIRNLHDSLVYTQPDMDA